MKISKIFVLIAAVALALSAILSVHAPATASVDGSALRWLCGMQPKFNAPTANGVWPTCYTPPQLRGIAFTDTNANGKWDVGEQPFGSAWYKVTGGGSWYACGWVGNDGLFGVPVNADTYYVIPVAPAGYRTTTPRITVAIVNDINNPFTYMGFVPDPKAKGEACDQYNPSR